MAEGHPGRHDEHASVDDDRRGGARLTKNWDDDVRAFDAVYDHILKMADALIEGISSSSRRSSGRSRLTDRFLRERDGGVGDQDEADREIDSEVEQVLLTGVNYPWTIVRGSPNYGCDFGLNVWRAHSGVTTHPDEVRQDFAAMASIGLDVVRWFVFADGRGGVRWNDAGVAGLAPGFFEDMDAALGIALDAGVRLCLVLFDYSWMLRHEERDQARGLLFRTRPDLFSTPLGRRQVIEALVIRCSNAMAPAERSRPSATRFTRSTSSTSPTG